MTTTAPKGSDIAHLFAGQYYPHLVTTPETAHNFYHAEAGFSRFRGTSSDAIVGHEKIKAYIASSNYQSRKFVIDTIDSQEKGKEIIVLVSGVEMDEEKVVRPFCQTFLLEAINGTRYLVRNDILRYLRSEVLNVGEPQKVETPQSEIESPVEDRVELKDEPVQVEAQDDLANLEPTVVKEEEPQQETQFSTPVEEEQPAPVAPAQPAKQHKSRESKREHADPSKPRPWASVVGGGGVSGPVLSEPVNVNADTAAEEEIITTPASTTAVAVDKPKSSRPEVMNSLYVSNLGAGCDIEEIKELFSRYGKVKTVKYTPLQSYCFVDYETADAADKALKGGPLKLGDSDLKLDRRKTPTFTNARGRGRGGSRGGSRGRGGAPRGEARSETRTTDRTERREPRGEARPREGNDRRPPNKEGGAGRSRGRGGARPTPPPSSS